MNLLDLLIPRIITEETALSWNGQEWEAVCRMADIKPGETFDAVVTISGLTFLGLMFFGRMVDEPRPWPGARTLHPELPTPGILKGVARHSGDGFKDPTRQGDVVYVWNTELPAPYAPGQYPRVGNHIYSASTDQFDFIPVPTGAAQLLIDSLIAQERSAKQDANAQVAWLKKQLAALEPVATPTSYSPEVPQITTEMKAQFMGEFSWEEEAPYYDEDGELHEDHVAKHTVPWSLCKTIYKEMSAFAAASTPAACDSTPVENGIGGALAQTMIKRSEKTQ
jgi:hypothetical protein